MRPFFEGPGGVLRRDLLRCGLFLPFGEAFKDVFPLAAQRFLTDLLVHLARQSVYRFYAASLLFVYDGDPPPSPPKAQQTDISPPLLSDADTQNATSAKSFVGLSMSSTSSSPVLRARLIDFAHAHRFCDTHYSTLPDDGCLLGVSSALDILAELYDVCCGINSPPSALTSEAVSVIASLTPPTTASVAKSSSAAAAED